MAEPAAVGRVTPFERVFADERFSTEKFPALVEEARESGRRLEDRQEFAMLARTGILLQELTPADSPPAAIQHYLELLFHAVHFWRAGMPVFAFEEPLVRFLVESDLDLSDWLPRVEPAVSYIELPALFWVRVDDELSPEPLEGFFLMRRADGEPQHGAGSGGELLADMLMVLGMRESRPGFSVVPLTLNFAVTPALPNDAFSSDLPGAEEAGLYSIRDAGEALALVQRLSWYRDEYQSAAEVVGAGAGDSAGTRLAYKRMSLKE